MTFLAHLNRDKLARDTYHTLNNSQRETYLKRWNEENKKQPKKKGKK